MKKRQTVNLFDDSRKRIIAERLAAFDREAAESGEPEELIAKLRRQYEAELQTAATVTPDRNQAAPSAFQQLLGRHRIRELERAESRRLEYPNSEMGEREW